MTDESIGIITSESELQGVIEDNELTIQINIMETGPTGNSAYELWLQEGNIGTITEFLESLKGLGYIHDQMVSSKTWIINHDMNKFPSVSVIDTGGNLVMGDVEYISNNQINICFSSEFSGKAFLN